MLTLLPPNYVEQPVTQDDMNIASLAWGFTLGFGFLTVWTALKQTRHVQKRHGATRLNSPYIWMIWLEITVCLAFSVICWLHLRGIIPPSFAFFFCILTLWALQVQFLLQIIINRVSVLLVNRQKALRLKVCVAVLITAINISVYCIWVPARLQISETYVHLNEAWDRCEKIIYLIVDAALNWYFIRIVQRNLVRQGLKKYESLVKFNIYIIGFSLSMDVLIISMMSLKNSFVYMQFHPLAYIVKLKIEMSMADLIATVSRSNEHTEFNRTVRGPGQSHRPSGVPAGTAMLGDKKGGATVSTFSAANNGDAYSTSSSDAASIKKKAAALSDDDLELREIMRAGGMGMGNRAKDINSAGMDDIDENEALPHQGPLVVHQHQEISVEVENVNSSAASGAASLGDDSDTRPLRNGSNQTGTTPGVKQKGGLGLHTKVWHPTR